MDVAVNETLSGIAFLLWLVWIIATSVVLVWRPPETPTR